MHSRTSHLTVGSTVTQSSTLPLALLLPGGLVSAAPGHWASNLRLRRSYKSLGMCNYWATLAAAGLVEVHIAYGERCLPSRHQAQLALLVAR